VGVGGYIRLVWTWETTLLIGTYIHCNPTELFNYLSVYMCCITVIVDFATRSPIVIVPVCSFHHWSTSRKLFWFSIGYSTVLLIFLQFRWVNGSVVTLENVYCWTIFTLRSHVGGNAELACIQWYVFSRSLCWCRAVVLSRENQLRLRRSRCAGYREFATCWADFILSDGANRLDCPIPNRPR